MNKDTIASLTKPFPADVLMERDGVHGKRLRYVPAAHVVQRLNEAFQHGWSFTIKEWQIQGEELVVIGELEADGIRKQGVGGSAITKSRDGGKVINLADDLKAATADCLKRCAMLCGCALHLYLDRHGTTHIEAPNMAEKDSEPASTVPFPGNSAGRSNGKLLTSRQYAAILAVAKKAGYSEVQLKTRILDAHGTPLEELDRRQASEIISALNNGNGKSVEGAS